jgi:peptidoglycan/xylan/chitin deacetylase (PgdA/CDA1 family)
MYILYTILLLFFATMFCAVKFLNLQVFGKSICKISNAKKNEIYLTFDDGPSQITPKVLELLKKYNQKASFFCIAENAKRNPEIVKNIVKDGHTLGSHDLHHHWTSNFRRTKQMTEEIGESVRILQEIINNGKRLCHYRPPVGLSNPHLFVALKKLNLQCVGWSKSTCDGGNRNVWAIKKLPELAKKIKTGDIVLLHDNAPVQNEDLFLQNLEKLLISLSESGIRSKAL